MITDPEHVLICAVEYALPRHTYIVSVIADQVRARWAGLGQHARQVIVCCIDRALTDGTHLWPVDRETWEALLGWCRVGSR